MLDSLARETALENELFDMIHAQVREHVFARATFLPPHGLPSGLHRLATNCTVYPDLDLQVQTACVPSPPARQRLRVGCFRLEIELNPIRQKCLTPVFLSDIIAAF
jgi:hypothetical protein